MFWESIQEIINRIRWLGGQIDMTFPETMSCAVVSICWGLPLKSIRKTGVMPDVLIEASDEFFKRVQEEFEAEKQKEENKAA